MSGSAGRFGDPDGANGTVSGAFVRAYRLPPGRIVRRAREWRLYDQVGDRYADFWQGDGAAFLGHRPAGFARTVAAEIDRGLWTALPTPWPRRLTTALHRLAQCAGLSSLTVLNGSDEAGRAGPKRWFPLATDCETPVRAGTSSDRGEPYGVVLPAPIALSSPVRRPEEISPVLLAALTRSVLLLLDYMESDAARNRLELARSVATPPGWRRSGCWFLPASMPEPADRWERIRSRALERAVVLPPDSSTPMVVPGELGRRERAQWKELCDEWSL